MLVVACVALIATGASQFGPWFRAEPTTWGTRTGTGIWSFTLLSFPIVGWLVARRESRNPIGWLLLTAGFAAGVDFLSGSYALAATRPGSDLPLGPEVGNIGNWAWMFWIGIVGVFVTHLFPTGRPLSRRWRAWIIVLGVMLAAGAVAAALEPGGLETDADVPNPFGVEAPIVGVLGIGMFALPVGVATGAASVFLRYRRAGAIERAQLRWFMAAVALVAVGFAAVVGISVSSGYIDRAPRALAVFQDVVDIMWTGVPLAIGFAILRYRLYAIDIVINRALVYGSLSAVIIGVYFVSVVVFQAVLRPLAGEGQLAVAGSTLVVAALFRPLRGRIQSFIDRRFYRARYDATQLTESFAARMRQQVDLDGIRTELAATARSAVQPASASVWVRPR